MLPRSAVVITAVAESSQLENLLIDLKQAWLVSNE